MRSGFFVVAVVPDEMSCYRVANKPAPILLRACARSSPVGWLTRRQVFRIPLMPGILIPNCLASGYAKAAVEIIGNIPTGKCGFSDWHCRSEAEREWPKVFRIKPQNKGLSSGESGNGSGKVAQPIGFERDFCYTLHP